MVIYMAYYNPSRWIEPTDSLILDTENILILKKLARQRAISGPGRKFLPPVFLEFDVTISDTDEVMRMTEWVDTMGKIYIDLASDGNFLRKGHFNQGWHHNPNGRDIPPPHHVHFPTVNYPSLNTRSKKYAYSIKTNNNYVDALLRLCDHNNIEVRGVSIPLAQG